MAEEKRKIVAVITQFCTLVGEAIYESVVSGTPKVISLDSAAQIVNSAALGPQGPQMLTFALKLGKVDRIPDNAIIAELEIESPLYKEWSAQWFDLRVAKVIPFAH